MRRLTGAQYDQLVAGASVIDRDWLGDRVLFTPDGRVVKLFRTKRVFSSDRVWPYARRFVRNANKLTDLGFRAVQVEGCYRCPAQKADVVVYRKLPGLPVRHFFDDPAQMQWIFDRLPAFIARLHDAGIYFKALHLGNLLHTPGESDFGLIDVDFMTISRRSVRVRRRVKNFRNMLRYDEDREVILAYGFDRLVNGYLAHTRQAGGVKERLARGLQVFTDRLEPPNG
jgi:hypothetical protein